RSVLGTGNLVEAIDAALDASPAPRGVHFVADEESLGVPDLVRAMASSRGGEARLRAVPVPLLRIAGSLSGRRATVERLTESLEVDPATVVEAAGVEPPAPAWRRRRAGGGCGIRSEGTARRRYNRALFPQEPPMSARPSGRRADELRPLRIHP